MKDAFKQNIIQAMKPNDRLISIHFIIDFLIPLLLPIASSSETILVDVMFIPRSGQSDTKHICGHY